MTSDIRVEPEEFDAAWLTAALEEAGVARGATITELEWAGYVGTGQMSRNARFRLDVGPTRRPAGDRGRQVPVGRLQHQVVGRSRRAPTPASTSSTADHRPDGAGAHAGVLGGPLRREAARRFVLVMEDLADSAAGDQFAGCPPTQIPLGDPAGGGLPRPPLGRSVAPPSRSSSATPAPSGSRRLAGQYEAAVGICLARLGTGLDDDVAGLVAAFAGCRRAVGHGHGHAAAPSCTATSGRTTSCSAGPARAAACRRRLADVGLGLGGRRRRLLHGRGVPEPERRRDRARPARGLPAAARRRRRGLRRPRTAGATTAGARCTA